MNDSCERVVPTGRVLKAREATAWITELADLRAARTRTERRREAARRGLRIARAAARREGLEEAEARTRAEVDETLGRLLARAEMDRAEMHRIVPDLVTALLRQVVGECDADAVLADAVAEALAQTQAQTHVQPHAQTGGDSRTGGELAVLRVPEGRTDAVRALADRAELALAVETDERLDAGQALLVVDDMIVDVGLRTRLDAVCAAFEAEWAGGEA